MSISPIQKLHDTTTQSRCELVNLYLNRVNDEPQINSKKKVILNIDQATIDAVINSANNGSPSILKMVAQCQNICNDSMFLMLTLLSRNVMHYPTGMMSTVRKIILDRPLCKKLVTRKNLA